MGENFINKQNVKVIILAGCRDFGRYPLASHTHPSLWPVAGQPAIERLLRHLGQQGIKQAIICSNGDAPLLRESIADQDHVQLKFLDESLPVGTAGCIRDGAGNDRDSLFVVLQGAITSPPNIDELIRTHQAGKSDLTVMFEPSSGNGRQSGQTAEIYICQPSILDYIPKGGYCDIKEGLIPKLLQAGRSIHAATMPQPIGNFRNRREYLAAIANYLENGGNVDLDEPGRKLNEANRTSFADSATIDPSARFYGPVTIMDDACVSEGVIIFGPTIIGRNARIGANSLIVDSVLWDNAEVGQNCEIHRCVIDRKAAVANNSFVEEESIVFDSRGLIKSSIRKLFKVTTERTGKIKHAIQLRVDKMNEKLPLSVQSRKPNIFSWFIGAFVLLVFIWSYWPGLSELWNIWQRSDEYSSGLLVPFLCGYILWSRRHDIARCHLSHSIWGVFIFLVAQAIRFSGLFFMYSSAERLSIVLSITGMVLLLFGWQILRKVFTVLIFLGLMLPLPRSIHSAIMLPLQSWATSSAVFCLEILGFQVIQEGNIIHLNNTTVAVAEACNGLRMIMAFFVIGGLVIMLARKTWWEKVIVLVSCLPIALVCNCVRLTITAIAFTRLHGEYWEKIFHDFGGYAMMPLALGIILFEFWLLTKITTVPIEEKVIVANK